MPKLPRYQQKGTLPDRGGVQSKTDVSAASAPARAMGALADQVTAGVEHFAKLKMANEETDANIRAAEEMAALDESLTNEPEQWDDKKVADRLNEIEANASSGLTFQEGKNSFKRNFGITKIKAQVGANAKLREFQISKRKISREVELQALQATLDGAELDSAVDEVLRKDRELGFFRSADEQVAAKIAIMKKFETSNITNAAETNPIYAETLIDKTMYLTADERRDLRDKVVKMKPKVQQQQEMAMANAEDQATNGLFKMAKEQGGTPTLSALNLYKEQNPLLPKDMYDKFAALAVSKATLNARTSGKDYNWLMGRLIRLSGDELSASNLKKESWSAEEARELLRIKGDFIDLKTQGVIGKDRADAFEDLLVNAMDMNHKFMKNHSVFATAFDESQRWGRQVARQIAKQGGGYSVDSDDLAMEAFDAFLTKVESDKKLAAIGGGIGSDDAKGIEAKFSEVMRVMDREAAMKAYKVTEKVVDGKLMDWVEYDGTQLRVSHYQNGAPVVAKSSTDLRLWRDTDDGKGKNVEMVSRKPPLPKGDFNPKGFI